MQLRWHKPPQLTASLCESALALLAARKESAFRSSASGGSTSALTCRQRLRLQRISESAPLLWDLVNRLCTSKFRPQNTGSPRGAPRVDSVALCRCRSTDAIPVNCCAPRESKSQHRKSSGLFATATEGRAPE